MEFIKRNTGLLLIGSIVIGYLFPQIAVLKPTLSYLLILMLFISLLKVDMRLEKLVRPQLVLFPIVSWVVAPVALVQLRGIIPDEVVIGLVMAAITPPALGSPVITTLAKGDLEFAMANVVFFNSLAPFSFALIPFFLFSGTQISIPVWSILGRVATIVFIPLVASLAVRRFKGVTRGILRYGGELTPLIILFLVAVVVSSAALQIRALPLQQVLMMFGLVFLLTVINYVIGHVASRGNALMQRTLPITTGHKNTGLAILVCIANFSSLVAIPSIFYIISHHICNAVVLHRVYHGTSRSHR